MHEARLKRQALERYEASALRYYRQEITAGEHEHASRYALTFGIAQTTLRGIDARAHNKAGAAGLMPGKEEK